MTAVAVVFGCAGTSLNAAERSFFRAAQPWGFILFKRNIADPNQVRASAERLKAELAGATPSTTSTFEVSGGWASVT